MYSITWVVHGELHSISSPNRATAELLVAILPRWMRPRLWHKSSQQPLLLIK